MRLVGPAATAAPEAGEELAAWAGVGIVPGIVGEVGAREGAVGSSFRSRCELVVIVPQPSFPRIWINLLQCHKVAAPQEILNSLAQLLDRRLWLHW